MLGLAAACNKQPINESPTPPAANSSVPTNGSEVSLSGETVCLPHKNPGDFQTLECAIGFKDTAGNYYALRNQPMEWEGTQVKGKFTADTSGNYDVVGIIDWHE